MILFLGNQISLMIIENLKNMNVKMSDLNFGPNIILSLLYRKSEVRFSSLCHWGRYAYATFPYALLQSLQGKDGSDSYVSGLHGF